VLFDRPDLHLERIPCSLIDRGVQRLVPSAGIAMKSLMASGTGDHVLVD